MTRPTTSPDLTAPPSRAPSTPETVDPDVDVAGSGVEDEEEEGGDIEDPIVRERSEAETRVTVKIGDAHQSRANRATSHVENADARTGAMIRAVTAEMKGVWTPEMWSTETPALKEETITLLGPTTTRDTTPIATVHEVVAAPEDAGTVVDPGAGAEVQRTTGTVITTNIMTTVLDNSQDPAEIETTDGTRTEIETTGPLMGTLARSSVLAAAAVPDTETDVVRETAMRAMEKLPRHNSTVISYSACLITS